MSGLKSDSLDDRVEDSKRALENYPQWVRENNYFSGGQRNDSEADNRDLEE